MVFSRTLLLLLLSAPITCAMGNTDAVNERIPVTRAEMETHWQLDCKASWNTLLQGAKPTRSDNGCNIPSDVQRQLQLCGFIYQPPGQAATHVCPDHQRGFQAAEKGDCGAIHVLARDWAQCRK